MSLVLLHEWMSVAYSAVDCYITETICRLEREIHKNTTLFFMSRHLVVLLYLFSQWGHGIMDNGHDAVAFLIFKGQSFFVLHSNPSNQKRKTVRDQIYIYILGFTEHSILDSELVTSSGSHHYLMNKFQGARSNVIWHH